VSEAPESYEAAVERLEQIIDRLDSGQAGLRETLELCREGRELVLVDAGCEVDGYTADVTRTFPVGAPFSVPQRRLYETVLEAQLAAIEAVKPGATIDAIHEQVLVSLTRGLVTLGLLEGTLDDVPKLVESGAYKQELQLDELAAKLEQS